MAWHLNNFAWMAATATDPQAHAGPLAIGLAEQACAVSGWGCWSFLGTLAAAFARCGDFGRATAWQRISLRLTPAGQRSPAVAMLRAYEAGQPWEDRDPEPAAGETTSPEELAQVDVPALLQLVRQLVAGLNNTIH